MFKYNESPEAREKRLQRNRNYFQKNKERLIAFNKEYRKNASAAWWEKNRAWHRKHYRIHRHKILARNHAAELEIKIKVFAAYGNKCTCCGETEFWFLCMDHIKNDGYAHKIGKSISRAKGKNLYRWLWKQGCPKDRFQLLCHNCNGAKAIFGYCVHKKTEGVF